MYFATPNKKQNEPSKFSKNIFISRVEDIVIRNKFKNNPSTLRTIDTDFNVLVCKTSLQSFLAYRAYSSPINTIFIQKGIHFVNYLGVP